MKRLFTLTFFLLIVALYTSRIGQGSIHAQTSSNYVDSGYAEALKKCRQEGSLAGECYGAKFSNNQYAKLIEDIAGPVPGITAVANDPEYNKWLAQKSFINNVSNYITMIYKSPPASTYAFVSDLGQSLGFIPKQTYAQGVGFSGLKLLLPLWKAFRNVAYLCIALVMVIIGFMIMFRKKIDPKTVVTVQNAIPRVVIALIVVTFSYALVGFVIDLMYVVMYLFGSIIVSISNGTITSEFAQKMITGGFFQTLVNMWGAGFRAFDDLSAMLGGNWVFGVGTAGTVLTIGGIFAGLLNPAAWAVAIIGVAIPLVIVVILVLAILFAAIRLFFLLVNAYIQIILALLLSPIQLMLIAIPGNHAFESWLKNLIANVVVFPISFSMILIAALINRYEVAGFVGGGSGSQGLWGPPMLAPDGAHGMSGLIGLGMLFVIPSISNGIKEALKAKPMIPSGPGAIMTPVTGTVQTVMGTASQFYYGSEILGKIFRPKTKS